MAIVKLSREEIQKFQKEISEWYKKNQRNLPWRQTRDPYKILISEVMSQQTQISRVVPKYLAWLERFPTLESLADAPTSEVLRYWNGLGYNRRALYLQKAAKELTQRSQTKTSPHDPSPKGRGRSRLSNINWPQTEEELRKLPGIGEYTARAILCFAFDKQIAVVDTNIRKVILVHFLSERAKRVEEPSTSSGKKVNDKQIYEIAELLLPEGQAYAWNQALMDYSALIVSKDKQAILHLRQGFGGQAKQSHFKTSNRFYRGQVIRILLKGSESIDGAFGKLENNGITKEKFEEILRQMEKDKLVLIEGKLLSLP